MTRLVFIINFLILFSINLSSQIHVSYLPDLPTLNDQIEQKGLAGGFVGISNGALLFAGGANFPEKLPWEGGKKRWWDDIYVLEREEQTYQWRTEVFKLDRPIAYGLSVTIHEGVLCIGGSNEEQCFDDVFLLKWENGEIKKEFFPSLPVPLANMTGALVGNKIFVAGGQDKTQIASATKHFFSLDLSNKTSSNFSWEALDSWQGKPRAFSVGVSQNNGVNDCFYMFSGRNFSPNRDVEILYDAYCYDPSNDKWEIISDGAITKFPFMAGTAVASGSNNIVFFGGDSGDSLIKEMNLKKKLNELKYQYSEELSISKKREIKEEIENLKNKIDRLLVSHKGFSNEVYAYHTVTKTLNEIQNFQSNFSVTTNLTKWENDVIIASGEIRPGVRTPKIQKISIKEPSRSFGFLNYLVLLLYFAVLVWMGFFFSKRQKNTDDYFKGGNRIPWWAAGLSVFGTALSAITFIAIPAKVFSTDWSYFMLNMGIILVAPVISILFIPFYRRLNITTAYEYLEKRFNLASRLIGSGSFILFQFGRMGVVLYLPAIALNVVTGIDIFICITVVGLLSLLYTMLGGIEAVIWTDALQVVILLGGAMISLIIISLNVEENFLGIIKTGIENNKFNIIDLDFSLQQPTIWVMLAAGLFTNITTYGTDQTIVQRYLTTKDENQAKKSLWTNAVLTIPATIIFFFLGTALFVFYKENPMDLSLTITQSDAIFPWYIFNELPNGIVGLLVAAIFAASMSSVSSSMNSGTTAYLVDIHFRFKFTQANDQLKLARIVTFIIGIVGTLFALLMATWDISSLWDEFSKIIGLVLGGLGGLFLLGMLTERANGKGAVLGILMSMIIQYIVGITQPVHLLLYTATGFLSCFIGGWLFSLVFASSKKDIRGLTIYTMQKSNIGEINGD